MRILIHSNAPWAPTGYGQQTAIWSRVFRDNGHEVFISSFYGLQGAPMNWEGITVLPVGADSYGSDIIEGHYHHVQADLLLTLMDIWVLNPMRLRAIPAVAHWLPLDCSPLGVMDQQCLSASGAFCIAMSRFGQRQLSARGFGSLYVPHGIDTSVFQPSANRDALRAEMGIADRFVIGMNANNKDPFRKGTIDQLRAFAHFYRKHHDAVMILHTGMDPSAGSVLDLLSLCHHLGIDKAVKHVSQYHYFTGMLTSEQMSDWYSTLDLFSNCSFGEGFGLPIVEAQACGVPAVVTDISAMPEVCDGWKVPSRPFWNPTHKAEWGQPVMEDIVGVYEEAYSQGASYRSKKIRARGFAQRFDISSVYDAHWRPALKLLEEWCADAKNAAVTQGG